jgi:hypothetical protein
MWTYDNSKLNTTSAYGRLNTVRLLVGDTDDTDQQVQNEEITFALSQCDDNVYLTGAWIARILASKYTRLVDTQLDGVLESKYSDIAKQYSKLAIQLESTAKRNSGASLGVSAGGLDIAASFSMRQFDNPDSADTYELDA